MDLSEGNEGNKFRKDDVDVYQPNMGIAVGHCQKTEWLKYTVKVEADGDYEISANVAGENGTGSFVLYMDSVRIGDEIKNEGKGKDVYSVVSGGKATLKKGEHELKLEIMNNWIDIDYIEFKAAKDTVSDRIANIRVGIVEAESNFSVYNVHGQKLGSFTAKSMSDAMSLIKSDAKLRKHSQGVFFIRKNSEPHIKKVVVHE